MSGHKGRGVLRPVSCKSQSGATASHVVLYAHGNNIAAWRKRQAYTQATMLPGMTTVVCDAPVSFYAAISFCCESLVVS